MKEPSEPIIDTSKMSEAKRAAFELTESSREGHWEYPTFAGALFMGELPLELVHPYPELPTDIDERGRLLLRGRLRDELEAVLAREVVEVVPCAPGIDEVRRDQRVVSRRDPQAECFRIVRRDLVRAHGATDVFSHLAPKVTA